VSQSWFPIYHGPARYRYQNSLCEIMITCVIMNNMQVSNEQGQKKAFECEYVGKSMSPSWTKCEYFLLSKDRQPHGT
jgi:hypothetical protein